jgi:hypothetical protein
MQGIETIEPCFYLPGLERHLDSALGDAVAGLVAEERRRSFQTFS